jgi:hypothetical protein
MTEASLDPQRVRQYAGRMRRRCGWVALAVAAIGFWAARAGAGEGAPGANPGFVPPTEEACAAACQTLIDRCTGVFGPAMGDMRPFCTRAVVRRCRAGGVKVCDTVAHTPATVPQPSGASSGGH